MPDTPHLGIGGGLVVFGRGFAMNLCPRGWGLGGFCLSLRAPEGSGINKKVSLDTGLAGDLHTKICPRGWGIGTVCQMSIYKIRQLNAPRWGGSGITLTPA